MTETWKCALDNAAASSAIEGLPINQEKWAVISVSDSCPADREK